MHKVSFLLIGLLSVFFGKYCLAQTITPSATPTDSIETNIESIRNAVKKSVSEKLSEITGTNKKVAWAGHITTTGDGSFELVNFDNQTLTINYLPADLTIIDAKRQKITVDKLKPQDNALILGYQTTDSSMDAKRIVLFATLPDLPYHSAGVIADYSPSTNALLLIPFLAKSSQQQLKITSSTKVLIKENTKIKDSTTKSLQKGQKVVVTYEKNGEGASGTLQTALILPGDSQTSPSATPSGQTN